MEDQDRHFYGVQFHPEVTHTPSGAAMIKNFVLKARGPKAPKSRGFCSFLFFVWRGAVSVFLFWRGSILFFFRLFEAGGLLRCGDLKGHRKDDFVWAPKASNPNKRYACVFLGQGLPFSGLFEGKPKGEPPFLGSKSFFTHAGGGLQRGVEHARLLPEADRHHHEQDGREVRGGCRQRGSGFQCGCGLGPQGDG